MAAPLSTVLHTSFEHAVVQTTEALKSEGFGVLSEIDVQATLKQKLNADIPRYRILGACNPPFAHQALKLNPDAGLMMPCNVAVYENGAGGIVVSAVDPETTSRAFGDPKLEQLGVQVREKLARAIAKLG